MRAENDLVIAYGWELTRLKCGDRNRLGFVFGPNMPCFLVWGSIELVIVWVVKIDLVFVCGPKMTCFLSGHRSLIGFCVGGQKYLDFSVGDRN